VCLKSSSFYSERLSCQLNPNASCKRLPGTEGDLRMTETIGSEYDVIY